MAVLNKYHGHIPTGAVYIGRGSKWGNPFKIGPDGNRDDVCDKHHEHLLRQVDSGEITLEGLASLHGKDLVCFCAPKRCHGHTLEKFAEWAVVSLAANGCKGEE